MRYHSKATLQKIWADFARRLVRFHAGENWENIRLWGLLSWGDARPLLEKGLIRTTMRKENKTLWVWPTPETFHAHIEPLLSRPIDELSHMAGW